MEIDIAALEAQVSQLSQEDLIKQLVEIKTRQKVAQKKYYNPETAKKARLKRAEEIKIMTKMAQDLGLLAGINEQASKAAAEKLGESEAEDDANGE